MTRSRTGSVTMDKMRHVAQPGHITAKACKDTDRDYSISDIASIDCITLEMNHCMAFYDRHNALMQICSLAKAGHRQWGSEFLIHAQRLLECLEDR